MATKQFKIQGLNWLKAEEIQRVHKQCSALEQYGIKFKIEITSKDVQLVVSDFDDMLQSNCDDSAVTIIKRNMTEYQSSDDGNVFEDYLLIITINDELQIEAKLLTYFGKIDSVKL